MMKHMKAKLIICIIIMTSICTISILFSPRKNIDKNSEKSSTFSTQNWINHSEYRNKMVNDLLSKYQLVGMSKDNIIALLGKPEYNFNDFLIGYYVGHSVADAIVLYMEIDKAGTVVNYEIKNN